MTDATPASGVTIGPDSTVADAKAWLKARLEDGAPCPVCTQRAQTYRRRITTGAAVGLVHAWRTYEFATFHAPSDPALSPLAGDWGRLRCWDLISDNGIRRDDGGATGNWRITQRGAEFATGRLSVEKYVHLFDGRVMGWSGGTVTIQQALGSRFDLRELLGERGAA